MKSKRSRLLSVIVALTLVISMFGIGFAGCQKAAEPEPEPIVFEPVEYNPAWETYGGYVKDSAGKLTPTNVTYRFNVESGKYDPIGVQSHLDGRTAWTVNPPNLVLIPIGPGVD